MGTRGRRRLIGDTAVLRNHNETAGSSWTHFDSMKWEVDCPFECLLASKHKLSRCRAEWTKLCSLCSGRISILLGDNIQYPFHATARGRARVPCAFTGKRRPSAAITNLHGKYFSLVIQKVLEDTRQAGTLDLECCTTVVRTSSCGCIHLSVPSSAKCFTSTVVNYRVKEALALSLRWSWSPFPSGSAM
eukprot:m.275168 g.275168  ORF g.275168 m.275168 type:complete len:189 (+) comp40596_c0_seq1:117-683(+)